MTTIAGLDAATQALGGAVLGPQQIQAAFGIDPLAGLTDAERAAVGTIAFSAAILAQARTEGCFLVLRLPRAADGPLTMLSIAARRTGALDPKVHQGVGYTLRGEWTIDDQPFAAKETCVAEWRLVQRAVLPATTNLAYRAQDDVLGHLARGAAIPARRSAVEIAYDTLLWHHATGERLLAESWDWSRSASTDQGLAALGEFTERGLRVIAYSRAVKFGTLGVCPQR